MLEHKSNPILGLGIMPLQLLNLGVILPRAFMAVFMTKTPRGEL